MALVLGFALPALAVQRPAGLGDVSDVRFWSYDDYTRVVVELTRDVSVEVRRLSANVAAERSERLYLDLPKIWVGRDYADGIPVGDGLLEGVRLGQNTLDTARLVIDLERYEGHRLITLASPHRIVIDVYGERGAPGTGAPGSWAGQEPSGRLSMPLRQVQRVVIDPGHGGKDPGAIGVKGLREKDVNLRLSKLLATQLSDAGFDVVLTRHDDRYLTLEERTAVAESAGGDVFISIHTNASPRRATRGFEIYYLDASHERHSLRVAARENGVPTGQFDSLQRTLAKLRASEASQHSSELARLVNKRVTSKVGAAHKDFRSLGVKQGPFYVLFLSSMPSILLEAGFLTNGNDAKLLGSEPFLRELAAEVAQGLIQYRDRSVSLAGRAGP